ncbi:Pr6Pr family membrane protein [Streptococcus loxodontisalivarius]|uniref:Pr6Pr family membrane protein n=1 Tax=Streptococcus loxodontisalivarius TaxID=1349415 RepID=A0ABS2PUN3_9STRE|nr:Pr6Pr family membrane protein [Streptococcus loxodontisalivarius]MBM7643771.1 hypothetical protein [Streptococcus loxodontisalivarius]
MSKTQLYRLLVAILGIIGVSMQIYQDGWGMLLYYTVLSNILVFSFMLYLVYFERKNGPINAFTGLLRTKAGVTMAITITHVIYHFMLAPLVEPQEFWNVRNFLVHYIVPIAMILDTLFLDKKAVYRWFDPLLWTSVPLIYFGFALLNGMVIKLPIPGAVDSPFAYFFINVYKYGWANVLTNTLVISIAYILVGYLLFLLKRFIGKRA